MTSRFIFLHCLSLFGPGYSLEILLSEVPYSDHYVQVYDWTLEQNLELLIWNKRTVKQLGSIIMYASKQLFNELIFIASGDFEFANSRL